MTLPHRAGATRQKACDAVLWVHIWRETGTQRRAVPSPLLGRCTSGCFKSHSHLSLRATGSSTGRAGGYSPQIKPSFFCQWTDTPIQPHRRLIRVINSSSCSVLCSVRGAKFQSRIKNKQTQPEGSLLRQTVALIAHSIVAILGQSLRVERSVAVGVFSSALYHKTKTVGKNQAVEMSWGGGGMGGIFMLFFGGGGGEGRRRK